LNKINFFKNLFTTDKLFFTEPGAGDDGLTNVSALQHSASPYLPPMSKEKGTLIISVCAIFWLKITYYGDWS
jgi:hypothetical protein